MPANYASAVEHLYALGHELAKPRKFDLDAMRVLVESLGHPERRFKSVLIAGTNGKGSTSATLAAIVEAAGYRTGLYTSPHLVRINERIQIDGEPISDSDFAEIYDHVVEAGEALVRSGALEQPPSFFEMLTAMGFEYFAAREVDLAVLEVGMGGRLDATNVAEPRLSIICDVALDHQAYLGNTVAEIAREKAGIIRQDGVVVTLPQHPEANQVIGEVASGRNARGVSATQYVPNVSPGAVKFDELRPIASQMGEFLRNRYFLEIMGQEVLIESPLIGRHQVRNIALAIAAAVELNDCGFSIGPQQIAEGVRQTRWPGRFQLIPGTSTRSDIYLDVAHNPAGAWALRSTISEQLGDRPLTIIFGAMRDKAIAEMADILFPLAERIILTQAHDAPRAATPDELRQTIREGEGLESEATVQAALERAIAETPHNGAIVISGSIYLVGEALSILQKSSATAPAPIHS